MFYAFHIFGGLSNFLSFTSAKQLMGFTFPIEHTSASHAFSLQSLLLLRMLVRKMGAQLVLNVPGNTTKTSLPCVILEKCKVQNHGTRRPCLPYLTSHNTFNFMCADETAFA